MNTGGGNVAAGELLRVSDSGADFGNIDTTAGGGGENATTFVGNVVTTLNGNAAFSGPGYKAFKTINSTTNEAVLFIYKVEASAAQTMGANGMDYATAGPAWAAATFTETAAVQPFGVAQAMRAEVDALASYSAAVDTTAASAATDTVLVEHATANKSFAMTDLSVTAGTGTLALETTPVLVLDVANGIEAGDTIVLEPSTTDETSAARFNAGDKLTLTVSEFGSTAAIPVPCAVNMLSTPTIDSGGNPENGDYYEHRLDRFSTSS